MATRGQSAQQKKAFLAAFAFTGVVLTAARQAGVGRSTVYQWLERDEQFALAYRQAERDACDVLVAAAVKRAVQGVPQQRNIYDRNGKLIDTEIKTEYSDSLLMFLIKKRDPSYREASKLSLEHSGPDGAPIQHRHGVELPAYDDFAAAFADAVGLPALAAHAGDEPLDTA